MAVPPVRAIELERFEGTFNLSRVGGALITYALGPLFPNIGLQHVVLFGTLLLAEAGFVFAAVRTGLLRRNAELLERVIFGLDLALITYAIFLFAYDPNWSTYIVGLLVVIAGGFRFASLGALIASVVMAAAYVGAASYRDVAFGHPTEPQRVVFTVAIYLLAGLLMAGLLRELATLRRQRESFERQRAETEALRELDRMKTEFLAAMSHDFRTPLTVVRGNLELLLSERPGAMTPAQRDLAERAQRNVRRLEDFSEDLLEMARIEDGALALEREEVAALPLVRESVDEHQTLAQLRGQTIVLECGEDGTVSVDADRVSRVIANLLTNAIKYSPERSAIGVRAGRTGDVFRVAVIDRGPGVETSERERIFDKFARGRRSAGTSGTGLGLTIARSLAELHGGTVTCQETPGGGATFVLTLPLCE